MIMMIMMIIMMIMMIMMMMMMMMYMYKLPINRTAAVTGTGSLTSLSQDHGGPRYGGLFLLHGCEVKSRGEAVVRQGTFCLSHD